MTALRGTALVLALLVVAGCAASGTKARRNAVNSYFGKVATAQVSLLSKEGQINATLQSFSLSHATSLELYRLRNARRDIGDAITRVRALKPPNDAHKLHALIVERLVLQRSVVDELIATELYIPKLAATAPALQAAVTGLRADLAAITKAPAAPKVSAQGATSTLDRYGAAFGGYGDALVPVSGVLDGLSAPPILASSLAAERAAVARSITLCNTIRTALHKRKIATANAAIHSLFTVSGTLNGAKTRKEQAAAARAYDARLHQIDAVAIKVNRERDRLVKLIG